MAAESHTEVLEPDAVCALVVHGDPVAYYADHREAHDAGRAGAVAGEWTRTVWRVAYLCDICRTPTDPDEPCHACFTFDEDENPAETLDQVRERVETTVRTDDPGRYLRSSTGTLHLRAPCGVVEDDGYSASRARCGWESPLADARPEQARPDARLCGNCKRTYP